MAFPAGDVLRAHDRTLGVDQTGGLGALEAVADELDLAGLRLQALVLHDLPGSRAPVGGVALPVLGEPAHARGGLAVGRARRHHVVALLDEVVPGGDRGQVGGVERGLDPVEFVAAHGVHAFQAEAGGDTAEDLVVGLGLAQRLDGLVLQRDDAVVAHLRAVGHVAVGQAPLADVPALEVGAGREDDVGELGLALHPDGLRHDEGHLALAVGL